jgi:predicted DNA-binding transcriptional regulator YafY
MEGQTKTRRVDVIKGRFLEGGRFTVQKIAEEFGVGRRTAKRDLLDLVDMGVPLVYEKLGDAQKQWYVPLDSRKVKVTYNIREVMSLFLGRRMFDFLENTSLEEGFNKVYDRIESQLALQEDRARAEAFQKKLYLVHEGPKKLGKRASANLDEVLTGLLRDHKVKVHYMNHRGEKSQFTLKPYTLVAYRRGLYVVGAVEEYDDQVLTYSLERITKADWLKGASFTYPETFDPEKYFDKALFIISGKPVTVKLRFGKGSAPFIKPRQYHRTAKKKLLSDGRIAMTLKVPINFETVNWVLSFGSNVEVVAPEELRDLVQEELKGALKLYR